MVHVFRDTINRSASSPESRWRIVRFHSRMTEGTEGPTCVPAVWAPADSASRSRCSSGSAWADAKTAGGEGGIRGHDTAKAKTYPFRRHRRNIRLRPMAATNIVTSMSAIRPSKRGPSVPETPARRPSQSSSESVLPHLPIFVGIWRESLKSPARCISKGDESTCTSENCKAPRTTRSSMHTSPVVFVRGKEGPLIDKERSF